MNCAAHRLLLLLENHTTPAAIKPVDGVGIAAVIAACLQETLRILNTPFVAYFRLRFPAHSSHPASISPPLVGEGMAAAIRNPKS